MLVLCDVIVKRSGSLTVFRNAHIGFSDAFLSSCESNSDFPTEILIVPIQEQEDDVND